MADDRYSCILCCWRICDGRLVETDRLGNFSNYLMISLGLTVIGLIFGIAVALHYRFMPVGGLETDS
jgi:hypothetical protein